MTWKTHYLFSWSVRSIVALYQRQRVSWRLDLLSVKLGSLQGRLINQPFLAQWNRIVWLERITRKNGVWSHDMHQIQWWWKEKGPTGSDDDTPINEGFHWKVLPSWVKRYLPSFMILLGRPLLPLFSTPQHQFAYPSYLEYLSRSFHHVYVSGRCHQNTRWISQTIP